MKNGKKKKQLSAFDMTKDDLNDLGKEEVVDLLLRVLDQNRQLSEMMRGFMTEKYGSKAEKFENPDQLNLFGAQDAADSISEPESISDEKTGLTPSAPEQKETKAKRAGHAKNPMPSHLLRVPIHSTEIPSAEQLTCSCCGSLKEKVKEYITHSRFEFKPSTIFIQDFISDVFACTTCESGPHVIHSAKLDTRNAGPNLIAQTALSKFADHIPLHRQRQIYLRQGVTIAKSTMVGWLQSTADLLRPLYLLMKQKLLESLVIATDDTPVKAQDREHKRNIKLARIWVYMGDYIAPYNLFNYTVGRGREGPKLFLKGYKRFLQGDCFSGNLALCAETGAVFVACFAHARRYFIKALANNKNSSEYALALIQKLFEIESTAKELELDFEQTQLMREQESLPILANFYQWLQEQAIIALPKSSLGKAVSYCLNNWEALTCYTAFGGLDIDNNVCEREMKTVAIGRKNWLFFGSDQGGTCAEVYMSLISSCRRNNVEPYEYLSDLIARLSENPEIDLEELLPDRWSKKKAQTTIAEIEHFSYTPQIV